MIRRLVGPTLTVAVPVALVATALFAVGEWRRSEDERWCRQATASASDALDARRSACAAHRERQRVMFGSVWRTGGEAMARCGFELAELQLLADGHSRAAILAPYGIDPATFEPSSREEQSRFVAACSGDR